MNKESIKKGVEKFAPNNTSDILTDWIIEHKISVTVTPKRKTKKGDYRPPYGGKGHRITVNGSLNPYSFLITFIHEVAHLKTWNKFQNKVAPHGNEWKYEFQKLMLPFIKSNVFPQEINIALSKYMQNPAASGCSDHELTRTLEKFDKEENSLPYLEDIPQGILFKMEDGRIFQKEEKLRKYYRCKEIKTGRSYRINPLVRVEVLTD